jgi:nucleotide-binding universal stress UspA family protein
MIYVRPYQMFSADAKSEHGDASINEAAYHKKILVPLDGSVQSLRALNSSTNIVNGGDGVFTTVYILNVIEWIDENDESIDDELAANMEEQGKKMLRSILLPKRGFSVKYERIVKLGDPAAKIVEMAEKLGVDFIAMGTTGLGNAEQIGHVSSKVLKLTSIPVVLIK